MSDIKVYQINDCEWWVSKLNMEETIDFYLEESGLDDDDNPLGFVRECNIDKEGMWWQTRDVNDLEKIADCDEVISYITDINGYRTVSFGSLIRRDEVFKYIPFRKAIENNGEYKMPYIINIID